MNISYCLTFTKNIVMLNVCIIRYAVNNGKHMFYVVFLNNLLKWEHLAWLEIGCSRGIVSLCSLHSWNFKLHPNYSNVFKFGKIYFKRGLKFYFLINENIFISTSGKNTLYIPQRAMWVEFRNENKSSILVSQYFATFQIFLVAIHIA